MRALLRERPLYCCALATVVVGAAVGLYLATLAGAAIMGVGMFVAGATDPLSAPGAEGR